MRILGMDYGSITLGLSLSDETKTIASAYKTIRYKKMSDLLDELDKVFNEFDIELVVLGNPLNLDGSISKRCEETYKFKEIIEERYKKEVKLVDERYTTVIINNMLIESGTRRERRKEVVDKLSSVLILQSYLDRK